MYVHAVGYRRRGPPSPPPGVIFEMIDGSPSAPSLLPPAIDCVIRNFAGFSVITISRVVDDVARNYKSTMRAETDAPERSSGVSIVILSRTLDRPCRDD